MTYVRTSWIIVALVVTVAVVGPASVRADQLLLWNRFESETNVEDSDVGPGFQLTSYIFANWDEARIEPAMFGNGLYVNHDTREGWAGDGANFFAVDLWDVGVTPSRGTIEFWFKFKYDCSFHNHSYFFMSRNELTGHLPGPPSGGDTGFAGSWSGWNLPDRKRYQFSMGNSDWSPTSFWFGTPIGSAGPGGPLAFHVDSLVHFAFVWDANGIAGTGETVRIYVDGDVEASHTATWDTTDPFQRYLYLGSAPNQGYWDTYYNAVKGVTDNLKIWDYAKTDFEDRFVESPKTVQDLIEDLILAVDEINLANGISNSLDQKLGNALDASTAENAEQRQDAVNKLNAMINAVEAQRGKQISEADADFLVLSTLNIIDAILAEHP